MAGYFAKSRTDLLAFSSHYHQGQWKEINDSYLPPPQLNVLYWIKQHIHQKKKSAYFLCALMHWCCQSHPSFNIISICNEYLTHSHFWKRYIYKTLSALILENKYALLGTGFFCVFFFFFFSLGKIQFHCD